MRFSDAPECAAEPSRAACWAVLTAHGQSTHANFLSPDVLAQFRTHQGCVGVACGDFSVPCASSEDGPREEGAEFFPAALIALAFLSAAALCEHGVTRTRDALALLGLSGTVGALIFPEQVSDANGIALVFLVAAATPAIVTMLQGASMLFIQFVVSALTVSMIPVLGFVRLWRKWRVRRGMKFSTVFPVDAFNTPKLVT